MPHDTALIATVTAGLALAFLFGLVAVRLRLPPILGYLLAGVTIGPFTPGYVADGGLAGQLAEIGVMLLMFGVGLHFSVSDLMAVRRIAVPGALVQVALATALGAGVAHAWGWPWGSGLVFGLALSVASTVVLLRALEDRGLLQSEAGKIAVGWLIVEDLLTVLALVLLPVVATALGGIAPEGSGAAGGAGLAAAVALTLAKVAAFVAIMRYGGRRVIPVLLRRTAGIGSRELFTLGVLAISLGIAVGAAALFDVSFALGAFFAGVVVAETEYAHEAAEHALPLQDAFAVLFFVSVGMLFDPRVLVERPLQVLAVVAVIVLGKAVGAYALVRVLRLPTSTARLIAVALAQVGEFSFILVALGGHLGLLPREAQSLVVAGALLSITLNPVTFALVASRETASDHPALEEVPA
jgi:CPA2 family monovalent cation:H+ antiporter-2